MVDVQVAIKHVQKSKVSHLVLQVCCCCFFYIIGRTVPVIDHLLSRM